MGRLISVVCWSVVPLLAIPSLEPTHAYLSALSVLARMQMVSSVSSNAIV